MSIDVTALGANSIIRNTVINRNVITPVLYSICVNNSSPITLVSGDVHDINTTEVYQAVCLAGGQAIDASAATGAAASISVGPDSEFKALEWLTHLNLLEVGRTVLMKFYLSNAGNQAVVNLINDSLTNAHVAIQVSGGASGTSGELFADNSCGGQSVLVEVSCANITPGSEQVVFNILPGYGLCR